MNRLAYVLSAFALLLLSTFASAQEFSGGFKAGLNFSWLNGPSEENNAQEDLEDFSAITGFHIGATASLILTDQFGLRAELLYSQKGSKYKYDGPSYWRFQEDSGVERIGIGPRTTELSITNTYFELPIQAYARFGRIEFSGGVGAVLLIGSRATGTTTFTGVIQGGNINIDPFTITLDYNYLKDDPGGAVGSEKKQVAVGSTFIPVPATIGAYYQGPEDDTNLFNSIDLSLNAGMAFYLNQGLYLGFRFNYGLVDVTRSEQDVNLSNLDDNQNYILRDDQDRNVSLQASLGFRF